MLLAKRAGTAVEAPKAGDDLTLALAEPSNLSSLLGKAVALNLGALTNRVRAMVMAVHRRFPALQTI